MTEIRVESWGDLQDALFADSWRPELGRHRSNYAFRGRTSADEDLRSSLLRLGGDARSLEGYLLRNFRKYAHRDEVPSDSVWDWLALGQHHGLPTRLLDWTFSPYVALHFATSDPDSHPQPGAVWCVDYVAAHQELPEELRSRIEPAGLGLFTTEILDAAAPSLEDFNTFRDGRGDPLPLFFEPPSLDERIVNQSAVFSAMTSADASMDRWLLDHPQLCRKVIIPADLKWAIRNHLDQANVTERVLFPGLDGLCRWLRRYYGERPEDVLPASEPDRETGDPGGRSGHQ